MARQPQYYLRHLPVDALLYVAITLYVGVIYSTLYLVPFIRRSLVERFGYDVFDGINVIFVAIATFMVMYGLKAFHGRELLRYYVALAIIGSFATWYLLRLPYAIERIHLLQYGLLGALLYGACRRHFHDVVALAAAITLTYLAGLGDEVIQHLLPNRVGEIRDATTNGLSGLIGGVLYRCSVAQGRTGITFLPWQVRALVGLCAVTALGSGFFIAGVHGFGTLAESNGLRIHTSLTHDEFTRIDARTSAVSVRTERAWNDEARRHLFQRDFYFTNDFMARDGSFYRDYWRALGENRILETWYSRFLEDHASTPAARFSGAVDRAVGTALGATPVRWPDSLDAWVTREAGNPSRHFTSRVKNTLITRFSPVQLVVAEAAVLVLLCLGWCAAGIRARRRA